jgi:hypothetical protein
MGPSVNECDANPGSPFRSYWQAFQLAGIAL